MGPGDQVGCGNGGLRGGGGGGVDVKGCWRGRGLRGGCACEDPPKGRFIVSPAINISLCVCMCVCVILCIFIYVLMSF